MSQLSTNPPLMRLHPHVTPEVIELPLLSGARLQLIPLIAEHSEALFPILSEADLYVYTGGHPPESPELLRADYAFLEKRWSPAHDEIWLNWVVFLPGSGLIGFVQASITEHQTFVAWLLGHAWQGKGYALEASRLMLDWLRERTEGNIIACIHPGHHASQHLAEKLGMTKTSEQIEHEDIWCFDRA